MKGLEALDKLLTNDTCPSVEVLSKRKYLYNIIEKELKDKEKIEWVIKNRKPNFVLVAQTANVVEYNMKAIVQLGGNEYMLCKALLKEEK